MPAGSIGSESCFRPSRRAARCCNPRSLSGIVPPFDRAVGGIGMSDGDQAEPPRWLRAADFPLVALVLAGLRFAMPTRLGPAVRGPGPPPGQPAAAPVQGRVAVAWWWTPPQLAA